MSFSGFSLNHTKETVHTRASHIMIHAFDVPEMNMGQ